MLRRRLLALTAALLPVAALAQAPPRIRMFELYKPDLSFSDLAKKLAGKPVTIQGFMAPHLKVESDFFVLSNTPVETCPFCASEDQWIDTIIFVRMKKRQEAVRPGELIQVVGRLEIGPQTDAATGFVSRVRLTDASYQRP
ncbi:hypothetical protein [Roseateles toxinivorans]|uniref:DUF3299 domain-containing protein n=1 Tax=Roseateles toxinivorans TaxID=270368 RepID=A0A4V3CSY4_9BURK|nr:hypothetical protein [Roseateles toxinivorans]TDP62487.1 hypothetical protein DES47_10765 [Roseateles toxinivorans]